LPHKSDPDPVDPGAQTPEEKRRDTYYPATESEEAAPINSRYGPLFDTFRLGDILSAHNHTNDFKMSRTEYINVRLRFMVFFFSLAVPSYLLADYYMLTGEHFSSMVIARCIFTLVLVFIGLATLRKLSLGEVNILLGIIILAAALFYGACIIILQSGISEPPPVGYTFMPFMIIVMLGLFPLTLISSLLIMALVVISYIGLQAWLGTLGNQESINMFFLFPLFMGIVLWLQSCQLLMLLELYRESTRDVLTGLINRRVLMKFLDNEIEQYRNHGRRFSILMLDLDRFKRINDDYGHFTGDLVLKEAARLLVKELRISDIVSRFGGEEFVAILPGLGQEEAMPVAERMRKACAGSFVTSPDGEKVTFSTSIGVSEYIDGENIELALKRADDALYNAKEQGRNKVIFNNPSTA